MFKKTEERKSYEQCCAEELTEEELIEKDYCIICKNFMGFIGEKRLCKIYDKPKCPNFEFNGFPKPATPVFCATETLNEYLLSLPKKRENGNDQC